MFICDICGKQTKEYKVLHINLEPAFYRRDICKDCEPIIRGKIKDFINSITKSLTEELND